MCKYELVPLIKKNERDKEVENSRKISSFLMFRSQYLFTRTYARTHIPT